MVLGQRTNVKYKMLGKLVAAIGAGMESALSTQLEVMGVGGC